MEIWKDIKGYEGYYQVSDHGRVRSQDRTVIFSDGHVHYYKTKVLTPCPEKDGYLLVCLRKNGRKQTPKVHRLVAQAFIPNPHGLPIINHKDQNRTNNHVSNLEWCTNKYNVTYGNACRKRSLPRMKAVVQLTLDGRFIAEYESASEASRQTGFNRGHICEVARGKRPTANGFLWRWKSE